MGKGLEVLVSVIGAVILTVFAFTSLTLTLKGCVQPTTITQGGRGP